MYADLTTGLWTCGRPAPDGQACGFHVPAYCGVRVGGGVQALGEGVDVCLAAEFEQQIDAGMRARKLGVVARVGELNHIRAPAAMVCNSPARRPARAGTWV